MADFCQTGDVATLHRFGSHDRFRINRELENFSRDASIGLVLPALYSEFEKPAMRHIANELRRVRYLRRIVVALGKANYEEYRHAQSFFEDFATPVTMLWIESEPVQRFLDILEQQGITAGSDGKGRSCWLSYGFLLATGNCDAIALHDCDIKNYSSEMLARLCYPIAHPELDFEFCKGYYARITDRMHGRVTRLFMTPLIRAMEGLAPQSGLLRFLDSFRYPLAGEFAMKANLARVNRIPSDWGLEVGVLSEVYRNCSASRTCQVDLADNYDHKHQVLSPGDASQGLRRMTRDIAGALFRSLAAEGVVFGKTGMRALQVRYVRMAEDMIRRYRADALMNGLVFDLNSEELAVSVFAGSLAEAGKNYLEQPLGSFMLPNWNRVLAAVPEAFDLLRAAVGEQAVQPALCVA